MLHEGTDKKLKCIFGCLSCSRSCEESHQYILYLSLSAHEYYIHYSILLHRFPVTVHNHACTHRGRDGGLHDIVHMPCNIWHRRSCFLCLLSSHPNISPLYEFLAINNNVSSANDQTYLDQMFLKLHNIIRFQNAYHCTM